MNQKRTPNKEKIAATEAFIAQLAAKQGVSLERLYTIHPVLAARLAKGVK